MNITDRDSNPIDAEVLPLLLEARQYPPGHHKRKQCLSKIIRIIQKSKKLWYEHTPYYEDALQLTWLYFCQNICEEGTGKQFDPDRSSIITWLNQYLKWRLRDFQISKAQYHARFCFPISSTGANQACDVMANLAAPPDIPPILEVTRHWVETDPTGELRGLHILNRPDVNCQVLLLKRIFSDMQWDQISQEFDLPISTLSSFFQRRCMPVVKKFGEQQGFLDHKHP